MDGQKLFSIVAIVLLFSGCSSISKQLDDYPKESSSIQIDSNITIYSPEFLMRYRNLMNDEQKSIAWEIARKAKDDALKGIELDQKDHLAHETSRDHDLSFNGTIFSRLRTPNYISSIVTYENSSWSGLLSKFSEFRDALYEERIIPAFDNLTRHFGYSYHCIFGCGEKNFNAIYQLTNKETETLPTIYASVCLGRQIDVHRLNKDLYDSSTMAVAKYDNARDGFNFHLMVPPIDQLITDVNEQVEVIASRNRFCKAPNNSIDAFNYKKGREMYRLISKNIPEYYSTLNFGDKFALFNGDIWKLENLNDAKKFFGVKTID